MSKETYRKFYYKYLERIESNIAELKNSIFNKKPNNLLNIIICFIVFLFGCTCFIIPFFINKYPVYMEFNVATNSFIYRINNNSTRFIINVDDCRYLSNIFIGILASALITIIGSIRSRYISNLKIWKERYCEKLYRNLYNLKCAYENDEDVHIWLHNYEDTTELEIQESIYRQSEVIYLSCLLLKYLLYNKRLVKSKNISKAKIVDYENENKKLCDIAIKSVNRELFIQYKNLHTDCSLLIYDMFNSLCEKLGDRLDNIEAHVFKERN